MSVSVLPLQSPTIPLEEPFPNRVRWTREDCARLAEGGFLQGRYELIDGVIISKMGQNRPHANAIMRLTGWLVRVFGADYIQIQLPVDVSSTDNPLNEPEPDGSALNKSVENFRTSNPGPEDVLLVVEVSDSPLRLDQTIKRERYARAGFPEYWILDVNGRRLIRHRNPQADGTYSEVLEFSEVETVACLARPDAVIRVSDFLN